MIVLINCEPNCAKALKLRFEKMSHYYQVEPIHLHHDEFAVIYFTEKRDDNAYNLVLGDLGKFRSMTAPEYSLGISIGSFVAFLDEINLSYRHAKQASNYCFLYGSKYTLSYREVSTRSWSTSMFSLEQFENALRAGDSTEFERLLAHFARLVETDPVHLEAVELTLNNIIGSISKVIIDLHLQERLKTTTDLFAEFKKDSFAET